MTPSLSVTIERYTFVGSPEKVVFDATDSALTIHGDEAIAAASDGTIDWHGRKHVL
jgi:hypothetical protein